MVESFTSYESKIPKVIADGMVRHNLQTRDYTMQLVGKGMNSDALEIAALLHNIGRAYRKREEYSEYGELDHPEMSAEIAGDWLEEQGAEEHLVKKVRKLVRLHEEGGTKEAQTLVDADCISFLENTLPIWFEVGQWMGQSKEDLIEASKEKVEEEWNLIESDEAREMAREYYDKWLEWIEQREESLEDDSYS